MYAFTVGRRALGQRRLLLSKPSVLQHGPTAALAASTLPSLSFASSPRTFLSASSVQMATPKKRRTSSSDDNDDAASASTSSSPAKKTKVPSAPPTKVARLSSAHPEWPAPEGTIAKAATFIQRAAASNEVILLVPDKDADGLSAGMIMKRTLIHLGASPDNVVEHHIAAGKNPASDSERNVYERYRARWIIVLDQGSPAGPPLVPGAEKGWQSDEEGAVRTMVLDHHFVKDLETEGPQGSLLLNACKHEPVSTSSLLAWVLCRPFWKEDASAIDYLAVIGVVGDLSINQAFEEPWPDFEGLVKGWGKSKLSQAVAMLNARE
jgi:hypothetical protein